MVSAWPERAEDRACKCAHGRHKLCEHTGVVRVTRRLILEADQVVRPIERCALSVEVRRDRELGSRRLRTRRGACRPRARDRKSTRLNSSHGYISYAVFCLKKKKTEYK